MSKNLLQAIEDGKLDVELDEEMLENLAEVFTEMQESKLNLLATPERCQEGGIDPSVLAQYSEGPCFTSYFLESLQAGKYKTRKALLNDFKNFIERVKKACEFLDTKGGVFSVKEMALSILGELEQSFLIKIIEATFSVNEKYLYEICESLEEFKELFNFKKNYIESSQVDIAIDNHGIPFKLSPV